MRAGDKDRRDPPCQRPWWETAKRIWLWHMTWFNNRSFFVFIHLNKFCESHFKVTLSRRIGNEAKLPISPELKRAPCKWGLLPKSMHRKLYPWDYEPSSLEAQEVTQETLQKFNSTAQRNLCANKHPKLSCETSFLRKARQLPRH